MRIGVPKEIKNHEYRVGLTPAGVQALVAAGHEVMVQAGAGSRIGFGDDAYRAAGAQVVPEATEVYAGAELVVKVKEPQCAELPLLRTGQILFCYLHLAAAGKLAQELASRGVTAIAYETVTGPAGSELPLLAPMSQVAGRLAPQMGALALTMAHGGRGVLLPGVPGVPAARVVILGGGNVGSNAARVAIGMGAEVTLFDRSGARMRGLEDVFGARLRTAYPDPDALAEAVAAADLVIGAVYVPGRRAPRLLPRALVAAMRPGSALVDVAIDQGGCAETSRPTTHSDPYYLEEGVVHYCVANMPAAVARTATQALGAATLPYALRLAGGDLAATLFEDPGLLAGLQVHAGRITHAGVAEDLGLPYTAPESALAG